MSSNALGQEASLPQANLMERYVAPFGKDSMSILIYRFGMRGSTANFDRVNIERFDSTTHRPKNSWENFGDIASYFDDVSLSMDRIFSITRWRTSNVYDTLFLGRFDTSYDTLHGTLNVVHHTPVSLTFTRDFSYMDKDGLLQDSLVKAFQTAIVRDDRSAVASFISYPFHLNEVDKRGKTHSVSIRNRRQFLEKYEKIFTPATQKALLTLAAPIWYGGHAWLYNQVLSNGERYVDHGICLFVGWELHQPTLSISDISLVN